MKSTGGFQFPALHWFFGVVEDRLDPKKLGRVKVRIHEHHTGDTGKIPTEDLPWASVIQGITSAANSEIGHSPTGILEGTTVFGVFIDGESLQTPIILGTLAGMSNGEGYQGGFKDPNGKYPRKPGESDVNKLTRGEISGTAVEKRQAGVSTADVAFGGSWTEPKSPYAAKYPFNHVYESESGHVKEVDDTEGVERLSETHKSGTFNEVHPDGSKVTKVVKDNYSVTLGNDFVLISGNAKVTINGNSSVNVSGNADINVAGDCRENIGGNYKLTIGGNFDVNVDGHYYNTSGVHFKVNAPRVDLN